MRQSMGKMSNKTIAVISLVVAIVNLIVALALPIIEEVNGRQLIAIKIVVIVVGLGLIVSLLIGIFRGNKGQ